MERNILFTHIPKTAGTSFRLAAKEYFGIENTLFDYGKKSVETSSSILNYVYEEEDIYKFKQFISQNKNNIFLSGHFPTTKYSMIFKTLNTITFVRNPVEQVLSHYKHYITVHGYEDDLETFIQEKRFKNLQSRLLQGKPLELYGFVGITEEYSKSIELINDYYGINLQVKKQNVRNIKEYESKNIDDRLIDLIKRTNKKDIDLYQKAKKIFDRRVKYFKYNKPYTHIFIQKIDENGVSGIAYQKDIDTTININIIYKDSKIGQVKAKDFRPGLLSHNLPRESFVGFHYSFPFSIQDYTSVIIKTEGEI